MCLVHARGGVAVHGEVYRALKHQDGDNVALEKITTLLPSTVYRGVCWMLFFIHAWLPILAGTNTVRTRARRISEAVWKRP